MLGKVNPPASCWRPHGMCEYGHWFQSIAYPSQLWWWVWSPLWYFMGSFWSLYGLESARRALAASFPISFYWLVSTIYALFPKFALLFTLSLSSFSNSVSLSISSSLSLTHTQTNIHCERRDSALRYTFELANAGFSCKQLFVNAAILNQFPQKSNTRDRLTAVNLC